MSEVLGDAAPRDDSTDELSFGDDDRYVDEDDEDEPAEPTTVGRFISGLATPGALAITSLTFAVLSLLSPLVGYPVVVALHLSHLQSPTYDERATAICELVFSCLAAVLAICARQSANEIDEASALRGVRSLSGAAILLSIGSALQALIALIILAGVHASSLLGS